MKWVLVFALAGHPGDYRIHSAYIHQANCSAAAQRYGAIFQQTQARLTADCRREDQIELHRSTSVAYGRYVFQD